MAHWLRCLCKHWHRCLASGTFQVRHPKNNGTLVETSLDMEVLAELRGSVFKGLVAQVHERGKSRPWGMTWTNGVNLHEFFWKWVVLSLMFGNIL